MKLQTPHPSVLFSFFKIVVFLNVGLLTAAGLAQAKEDPPTLNAVVEVVKQKLAAGESRKKVAQYINDLVDRRLLALNRHTPDESESVSPEKLQELKATFDAWRDKGKDVDAIYANAYAGWESGVGHCNEHAHMVRHILTMAGEGAHVAELQCGDHIYVAWGVPQDNKMQLSIEDLRGWKNAYIIDPWQGVVKPTTKVSAQDKMLTDGGNQNIMRLSQAGSKVYMYQHEKWQKEWLKNRSQIGRDTCLDHEPATIARCYNFPLLMLTGRNEHKPINPERLVNEMKKAGFERVIKPKPLNDISAKELKFGDILLIGGQSGDTGGHTGIVWKFGKRKDVIRHFLGVTKWNNRGDIIYRSDKPKNLPEPLDHGIHIHTLDMFRKLGTRSSKKKEAVPYGQRPTSVWRSKWVKNWTLTKQRLTIKGKEMSTGSLKKAGGKLKITRFEPSRIALTGIDLKKLDLKAEPIEVDLDNYTVGKGKLSATTLAGKWTNQPATYHLKEDEIHAVLDLPEEIKMELWFNTRGHHRQALQRTALRHIHIPTERQQAPGHFAPAHAACIRATPDFLVTDPNARISLNLGSPASVDSSSFHTYPKDYLMQVRYKDQTAYTYWKCDANGVGIPFNDVFLNQLTPGIHEAEVLIVTEDGKRFKMPFPIEVGEIHGQKNAKTSHDRNLKMIDKGIRPYMKGKPIDETQKGRLLGLLVTDSERMLENGTITPEQSLKQLCLAMIFQEKLKEKPARRGGAAMPSSRKRSSQSKPKSKPPAMKSMAVKRAKLLAGVIEVCEKIGTEEACNVASNNLIGCDKNSGNDPEARKDLPRLYRRVAGMVIQTKGDIATARKYLQRSLEISQEIGKLTPEQAKKEKVRWPKPFVNAKMEMVDKS